jgi:hypothetical protein
VGHGTTITTAIVPKGDYVKALRAPAGASRLR